MIFEIKSAITATETPGEGSGGIAEMVDVAVVEMDGLLLDVPVFELVSL